MTREEREHELTTLLLYPSGRVKVLDAFIAAYDVGPAPPHDSLAELVDAILVKEFPVE